MTIITCRKGKVRRDDERITGSEPLGLTMDAHIVSPRYVANGRGSWEGTLADALDDDYYEERLCAARWNVREDDDDDDDDLRSEIESVVHRFSYNDISDVFDDPNVVITIGDHEDAEAEAWTKTHDPMSTKSYPGFNR